jgi:hypothetical protein
MKKIKHITFHISGEASDLFFNQKNFYADITEVHMTYMFMLIFTLKAYAY